ncbi:hypothetical protein PJF56_04475 [Roseofilum sp. BLCC_M91]|uniref:Uncharacterized protein n=1 Tax=Roseofilum halophilum BLCC-M91 TaxID=3022259 RepID=A0ABT7BHR1_9CYAN|nr:hypothetical protein [Roseofilum halophilum]MDJ1178114.1 hypothetical protein [Roseofilum halophilum BLCC-M91]
MARLEDLEGVAVAFDSVIFIYAIEGNQEFGELARKIFELIELGKCQGFACDLVLAELMVKPLRDGFSEIAEEYARDLPSFPNLKFCPCEIVLGFVNYTCFDPFGDRPLLIQRSPPSQKPGFCHGHRFSSKSDLKTRFLGVVEGPGFERENNTWYN